VSSFQSFISYGLKVLFEEFVGGWDGFCVPGTPQPALVATTQKNCSSARIEGKQHSNMSSTRTKLLHVRVARSLERVNDGPPKSGTMLLKQLDGSGNPLLLVCAELLPPGLELIGVLDSPHS
jgi:hypothetical protein